MDSAFLTFDYHMKKIYEQAVNKEPNLESFLMCYSLFDMEDLYDIYTMAGNYYERRLLKNNPNVVSYTYNKIRNYEKTFVENFVDNKDFHKKLTSTVFEYLEDIYTSLCEKDDNLYDMIDSTITIDDETMNNLLLKYFEEEDSLAYDIYQKLMLNDRFYMLNNKNYDPSLGFFGVTVVDFSNNYIYVFINYIMNNLIKLATIVHEVGHVSDLNKYSSVSLFGYEFLSLFLEIPSNLKEEKLYRYLLKNNLFRNDVLDILKDRILYEFESIYSLRDLTNGDFLNREYSLKKYGEIYDLIRESIMAYGYMLGTYFSENLDKYSYFEKRKYSYFDKKDLDNLGITGEEIVKSYQKKLKCYEII